jgi:hypothetical protein
LSFQAVTFFTINSYRCTHIDLIHTRFTYQRRETTKEITRPLISGELVASNDTFMVRRQVRIHNAEPFSHLAAKPSAERNSASDVPSLE